MARPWPGGEKRISGWASHHEACKAMESLLLLCVATGVSLVAVWCVLGATPRGQPWTSAVTLRMGATGCARGGWWCCRRVVRSLWVAQCTTNSCAARCSVCPPITLLCGHNCQALLSAFSSFFLSTAPFLRTIDAVTHILVVSTSGRTARVTHPVAASAFCVRGLASLAGLFIYGVLLAS